MDLGVDPGVDQWIRVDPDVNPDANPISQKKISICHALLYFICAIIVITFNALLTAGSINMRSLLFLEGDPPTPTSWPAMSPTSPT